MGLTHSWGGLLCSPGNALRTKRNCQPSNDHLVLDLESLESRQMLAGQVSVQVDGGNLILKGDADDNSILVSSALGTIRLDAYDGTELAGDASGTSYDTLIPDNALNDVTIKMKRGDDSIVFYGVNSFDITGRLTIKMGAGDDDVSIVNITQAGTSIAGSTHINMGSGRDAINIDNVTFIGPLTIKTGAGDDGVIVASAVPPVDFVRMHDSVVVKLGSGDDQFTIIETATLVGTNSSFLVHGGGGDDGLDTVQDLTPEQLALLGIVVKKVESFT